MIVYPKAELRLVGNDGGEMQGGPPRGVWHTTETNPAYSYDRGYYHLNLAMVDGAPKWVQLMDLGRASRALRRPGDVQTNRQGDYCINVSISGYARQATQHPDAIYNEMAELMVWCEEQFGIPAEFPYPFVGGSGYGETGAARLAVQDWIDLTGWVGHQHVPYNTHWDPGQIPVAIIDAKVQLLKQPPPILTPLDIGGINMDAATLTANTEPDEIRRLSAAGLFDGDPEWWVAKLDNPDDPLWQRFWTAVYINSLTR